MSKTFTEKKRARTDKNKKGERTGIPLVNCAICLKYAGAVIRNGEIVSISPCTDPDYNTTGIPGIINLLGECANTECDNFEEPTLPKIKLLMNNDDLD